MDTTGRTTHALAAADEFPSALEQDGGDGGHDGEVTNQIAEAAVAVTSRTE